MRADEPGELVHRGALVALGYWNDPEKTAERFKPLPPVPGRESGLRAARDRGVLGRHRAARTPTASCTSSAAATR